MRKNGFAPLWIILLILLFGGIFIAGRGKFAKNSSVVTSSPAPAASTESAKVKPKHLYDLCKEEIQLLPKLPFVYDSITTTGTNVEQYRKDRIKDKKYMEDYASCGLSYSTIKVIEQTYASLGLQYYNYAKDGSSKSWNTQDINRFPGKLDIVYGEILKKEGWVRQTKEGGEKMGYGLPTLIFYKDMGDKNYYIDVVVGPDPATLYLLIVKK